MCFQEWVKFCEEYKKNLEMEEAVKAAEKKVAEFMKSKSEGAKGVIDRMNSATDSGLCEHVISTWIQYWKDKAKKEAEIRVEYEERIEASQKRLFDYKQSQKKNSKGVLLRQAAAGDGALLADVFGFLCKEPLARKADEEAARKMAEIEAKLSAQGSKNKENAKAVLMRNLASGDNMLMDVCIEAWKSWLVEYKKNKESEDAVKDAEAKVAAFMKSKSEGAKGIIDRMNAATDSGLTEHIMSTWVQYRKDEKKAQEMEELLNGANSKFSSFSDRNKQGAMSAGEKATAVKEYGLVIHALLLWQEFTKVERLLRYYGNRVEHKKHQLTGLQSMFRNFANQLETGLKEGTPRDQAALKSGNRKLSKSENTVSLPNIQQKTSGGSHRSTRS
jgi:hypothetical protein